VSQLSHSSAGRNASVLNFLITITLATLGFIYLSLAAYTRDALWFYPIFDSQPSAGVIRCYGEQITLEEGSEHLAAITGMVNQQISGDKRWDELSLTDATYVEYQTSRDAIILELFYDEPQRIHSTSPFFSGFDSLLIPLDGRHATTEILFNLVRSKPSGGSFHVETFEPVRNYVQNNGICVKSE
jgi:hypothetical protein